MNFLLFIILSWSGTSWRAMSRSEILQRANQMIDGSWSPQNTQRGWSSSRSPYTFYGGRTYHGILYSQNNPVEDWNEFKGRIRTARKYYGYWSNGRWYNYIGNDCSGFASIVWGMPSRYTTSSFYTEANGRKRYVKALGRAGQAAHVDLKTGDGLNYSGHHIILVNRKITNGVQSMEQTPNNAKRRSWYYSHLSHYQPIRRKDLTDHEDTVKTEVEFISYPTKVKPSESFRVVVKATVKESDAPADLFLEVKDKKTGRILWSKKVENISKGTHNEPFTGISVPDKGYDYYIYFVATITPDGGSWNNKYDYATTYKNPTLVSDTTSGGDDGGSSGGDDGGGSGGDNGGGSGGSDGHGSSIPDPGSNFQTAYEIQPGTYTQYLDSADIYDFYKFYVHEGESITLTLISPENADFDMGLYDPAFHGRENSVHQEGVVDVIGFVIDTTGYWYLNVFRYSGEGNYTLKFEIDSIKATWDILVYLNTDNELDGHGDKVINAMEKAQPTPHVNVLVEYDSRNTSPKVYKIKKDYDSDKINSPVVYTPGNENLGSGNTLSDFVDWAHREYPARKYALVIKSSGAGWPWISKDLSSNSAIDMQDLKSSLSKIKSTLGKKLDLLVFDASLMGMWEVTNTIKDYADFLVASEEKIPADGVSYDFVNVTPQTDGLHLALQIVNESNSCPTLSVINLEKIGDLTEKTDKFAESLLNYKHIYGSVIDSIRVSFNGSQQGHDHEYGFDASHNNHDYIDLYRFAYHVASSYLPAVLRDLAHDVMKGITDAVPRVQVTTDYQEDSHGISIYYPSNPDNYNHTPFGGNYDDLVSSRETHWDEFIKAKSEDGNVHDYTLTTTTFNWINTSTPTGVTKDDQTKLFSLPFTFNFYGKNYNSVHICSNGFMSFTSGVNSYSPQNIPSESKPNALVAPLWRDLNPEKGGKITYYSGADKFVVTYDGVSNFRADSKQTFQVILYPNGEIVFQYKDITNDQATVIGIEDEKGTEGKSASSPRNGLAYRWMPSSKSISGFTANTPLYLKHMSIYKNNIHLEFSIKPRNTVNIAVYNLLGQRVYKNKLSPTRTINLRMNSIKSGVYIIFVKTGILNESRKVLLLK